MNRSESGPTGVNVDEIEAKVGGLLRDTDIGHTYTVVTPTSTSLDTASGVLTRTSVEDEVVGYLGPLTAREIEASSAYQEGDQRACVMGADLTAEPTVYSWIEYDGEKYAAVTVETDPLGVYREMVVRRAEQS